MHEQPLDSGSDDGNKNEVTEGQYEETITASEAYLSISVRGLEAVFKIGAINATKTWRRLYGDRFNVSDDVEAGQEPSDNS